MPSPQKGDLHQKDGSVSGAGAEQFLPLVAALAQKPSHIFNPSKELNFFFFYSRVIGVPHFGHCMSKQATPCRCALFSPQFGQTQVPPGPNL